MIDHPRRLRLAAEPLDQRQQLRIGLDSQLLLQQALMFLCKLNRVGPIARRCKRLHEAKRDPRVVRIDDHQPPPPVDRPPVIPGVLCSFGQGFDRSLV